MDGPRNISHDQNFKNLIIDYPLQAIELFSIHRLAHYCLDLSELCETNRVVTMVIFLNTRGREPVQLNRHLLSPG